MSFLQRICPGREWRLVHVDVTAEERAQHEERVRSLIMVSEQKKLFRL